MDKTIGCDLRFVAFVTLFGDEGLGPVSAPGAAGVGAAGLASAGEGDVLLPGGQAVLAGLVRLAAQEWGRQQHCGGGEECSHGRSCGGRWRPVARMRAFSQVQEAWRSRSRSMHSQMLEPSGRSGKGFSWSWSWQTMLYS